jgi:hypothetical protein
VVTLGTFLLLGGLTFWIVSAEETGALDIFILFLIWGPLVITWLFVPRGYLVSREGIVIRRAVGSFTIPAAEIEAVELADRMKPGIRLWASGGLFGWFGLFTLKDGGTAKVYATCWDRMVRIKASREIYLLSPAKPEAFVEAVHRMVLAEAELREGKSRRERIFPLAPADPETRIALLLLIIPLGVLSLVGVAVGVSEPAELPESLTGLGIVALIAALLMAVFFAFAPAAYILDAQGIRITRRLFRPVFVPYAQVKNVATQRFAGPPFAIVRLGSYPPWGFFGYFGRFKVERLGWIRVYATSWKNEMVVLETDREPYFLSPADPQRFYAALQARQVTGLLVG